MAVIQGTTYTADVDANSLGLHVDHTPKEVYGAYRAGSQSGIIAAATGANSSLFMIRNGPISDRHVHITNIRVVAQVVTAATVAAVTMALDLAKFNAFTALSGGTSLITRPLSKNPYRKTNQSACMSGGAAGGDIRIATTGGLTATGTAMDVMRILPFTITAATNPPVGARYERILPLHGDLEHPIYLLPGQGLAIRNNVATPTTFTFVLGVEIEWYEN